MLLHGSVDRMTMATRAVRETWKPPTSGWIKANTDGAMSNHGERGGNGVVLTDQDGAFRGVACHSYSSTSNPVTVELMACRWEALLAAELNFNVFTWKRIPGW